jgi:hypothetical protein
VILKYDTSANAWTTFDLPTRGTEARYISRLERDGAMQAKDSALASAGAEPRLANGVSLLGKFDGELARRSQTYAGTGTLRVSW